jgi:hypothetical protein
VLFLCPIIEFILYINIDSLSLREIYDNFDSMLGQVKATIHEEEDSLEFYKN